MKIEHAVYMKSVSLLFALVMSVGIQIHSFAQIVDPLKEYTNPDEIVTFDKSASYNEAIAIINTFAQEYENKFIVDMSGYNGEIGVSLPPMHWKDALQYIMRFLNLEANEYEDYIEIVNKPTPSATTSAGDTQTRSTTDRTGNTITTTVGEPTATFETREIRINATFFEGNKRALQEIGIDWSTLTSAVPENLADFVSGEQGESVPQTTFEDQFVAVNSFNASSVSQNAFNALVNLGEIGPGISVQALFSAFEADNLGKVLATPSIKVVDGQNGLIQVGQDFSIKQRDIAGNVTDNFVSTGTILNVTPNIVTRNDTSFIYLDLKVERSTVQPDVVSTIINTQEATTSAMLLDGESTYIAGLYRTEETQVRRGIPILKDLPPWFFGLRYLFGYNSKDVIENELIIIVQAELVKPLSERIASRRQTKREVLNEVRDNMRIDLDRVFAGAEQYASISDTEMQAETDPVDLTDELVEEEEIVDDSLEVEREDETLTEAETDTELTNDEEQLAKDLSIPVDHPELMVVLPKAFDLDQFLEHQENGQEVEEDNTDLKYFVIGGSFLVPNNAYNFLDKLEKEGYNSRMLFNKKSRFHYIAFQGFSDFDASVEFLRDIQANVNSEAWLFTMQTATEEITE